MFRSGQFSVRYPMQSKGINPLTKYLTDWVRHKSHKNL